MRQTIALVYESSVLKTSKTASWRKLGTLMSTPIVMRQGSMEPGPVISSLRVVLLSSVGEFESGYM